FIDRAGSFRIRARHPDTQGDGLIIMILSRVAFEIGQEPGHLNRRAVMAVLNGRDRKFIAAYPSDNVGLAKGFPQDLRRSDERLISRQMPSPVIDLLEA